MNDQASDNPKTVGLADLAPSDWFQNREQSSFWLRIYSCLFVPHAELAALATTLFVRRASHTSILMPTMRLAIAVGTGGYVFLATPFNVDGTPGREFDTRTRLAKILKRRRFLGPKAYVFGGPSGECQGTIRTACESLVLLAHDVQPRRTRAHGRVNREQLAEIDLHWHDLRNEARSSQPSRSNAITAPLTGSRTAQVI